MYTAAVVILLFAACTRVPDRNSAVEHHASGEASVPFDLESLQSGEGSRLWIATYNSRGAVAKFRIDLGAPESAPSGIKTGEGTLIPEPGSDSSILLVDLQKVLRATTAPKAPLTKTSIPFTYIHIGDNLSQDAAGTFNTNPPVNWTALKLIFGEGDRESQIFLHINPGTKKAQFSMIDPRYGDLALAELAKVL
jgi:hypothetical protein